MEPKSGVGGSLHLPTLGIILLSPLATSISFRLAIGHPCGSRMVHLLSVYFRALLGVFEGQATFLLALVTFLEEDSGFETFPVDGSSCRLAIGVPSSREGGTSSDPPWSPLTGLSSPTLGHSG